MSVSHGRRALLGLAVLGGAGLYVGPRVYPYLEVARGWYDVIGVDVSNHQGPIDWPALARTGVAFAYIKATEGGDFRDARFPVNWAGAKKAGIHHGAYHFFTPCRPGADQAKNFMQVVPKERGTLPPVLDLERAGPCGLNAQNPQFVKEVLTALDLLEAHYGRRPLLYTGFEFNAASLQGQFTRETFWTRSILLPPGFRRHQWVFWQFHSRGRRDGIKGPVDLNAFRGSRSDLEAFVAEGGRESQGG